MVIAGTIRNGQVQLDHPADLPDGARVTLLHEEEYEYPHPMAPYDRDKEIALLQESIQQMMDGRARPFDEVMTHLAAKYDVDASDRV